MIMIRSQRLAITAWLERMNGRRSRGSILVLSAVLMTVLLGFAALAVDVGYALSVKAQYQKIAATCAMVGASTGAANSGTFQTSAQSAAQTCINNNGVTTGITAMVPPQSGTHSCANDSRCNSFIEVIISNPQPTFFAKTLGITSWTVSGRAVAGGFSPAVFAMQSLQGDISSSIINGNPTGTVSGSACTRGSFQVNGSGFTITGEAAANGGFSGSNTSPGTTNAVPGPDCLDPNYPLPTIPWDFVAPPSNTTTTCVGSGPTCDTTVTCPSTSTPVDVTTGDANVYVNCSGNFNRTVRIFNPRATITIDGSNEDTVEIKGRCTAGGTPTCTSFTDPVVVQNVKVNGNNLEGPLILNQGYYDRIDLRNFKGSGNPRSPTCGNTSSKNQIDVCFNPGLYLITTGLTGDTKETIASNTTATVPATSGGTGVSFVVGLTFDPGGHEGSGGSFLNLDCCASQLQTNYILLYHLGGCNSPYSSTGNFPSTTESD